MGHALVTLAATFGARSGVALRIYYSTFLHMEISLLAHPFDPLSSMYRLLGHGVCWTRKSPTVPKLKKVEDFAREKFCAPRCVFETPLGSTY
jgi:hypothetical protein